MINDVMIDEKRLVPASRTPDAASQWLELVAAAASQSNSAPWELQPPS